MPPTKIDIRAMLYFSPHWCTPKLKTQRMPFTSIFKKNKMTQLSHRETRQTKHGPAFVKISHKPMKCLVPESKQEASDEKLIWLLLERSKLLCNLISPYPGLQADAKVKGKQRKAQHTAVLVVFDRTHQQHRKHWHACMSFWLACT